MTTTADQLGSPVDLRQEFAGQRANLIAFLRDVPPVGWQKSTACEGWTVADIAAHIVGDMAGRISSSRDAATGSRPLPGESLARFIDRSNAEWVVAMRRLSPAVILEMMEALGPEHDQLWIDREPLDPSLGVSWAGVDPAPVWLDAARDVTEYWIHETQIREALGDSGVAEPGLATVLDVLARGLPHALAGVVEADSLTIEVPDVGLVWGLERSDIGWRFSDSATVVGPRLEYDSGFLWRRWTRQAGPTTRENPTSDPVQRAVLAHVAIVHSDPDK